MCGLKAAEMHEQPFRATKELVTAASGTDANMCVYLIV